MNNLGRKRRHAIGEIEMLEQAITDAEDSD